MKKKKRLISRILNTVLALALVLSNLGGWGPSTRVKAAQATSYPLWIGGVQVTSENSDDLTTNHWAYNPTTNTLYLKNYQYNGAIPSNNSVIYYNGDKDLTIVLQGDNTILADTDENINTYNLVAIDNENCTLTITGSGSITINTTGWWDEYNASIFSKGPIVFQGGSVSVGDQYNAAHGIQSEKSVTVKYGITSLVAVAGMYAGNTAISGIVYSDVPGKYAQQNFNFSYDLTDVNGVELSYRKVVFPLNGKYLLVYDPGVYGVGSIASTAVAIGDTYIFPECTFESSDRKFVFSRWEMSGVDLIAAPGLEQPIADNCLSDGKIVVTAIWKELTQEATIKTDCTGITSDFDGTEKNLITAGEATNGTMNYVIGEDNVTAPILGWSTEIPKATAAGTYYVWYKARGDHENYCDSKAKCVAVKINPVTVTASVADATVEYDGSLQNGNSSVTFQGLLSGHTATIQYTPASGKLVNTYSNGSFVENSFQVKDKNGKDVTGGYQLGTLTPGKLTITNRKTPFEIEVKAKSVSEEYNGKPKSATGFETLNFTVNGNAFTVSGLTTSDPSSVKKCNNVPNTISGTVVVKDGDGNDVTAQFAVSTVNGSLTITENTKDLSISSSTKSWTYDGVSHMDEKYTVTYDGANITADGTGKVFTLSTGDTVTITPAATGVKDVGTYSNNNEYSYVLTNADQYSNVTKQKGTLSIDPKDVTITAQDKKFTYDGTAQSWPYYDVDGLVGEDAITAVITGSITCPDEGTVTNQVASYTFASGTAGNYAVTMADGQLTMVNASNAITITAASREWTYDATAHSDGTVTVTSGALFTGDALVATATGSVTGVADTADGNNPIAAGYRIMHGDKDVTASYVITSVAGKLTVNPRPLTILADAKDKTIGSEDPELTYQAKGLVGSDVITGSLEREEGEAIGIYAIKKGTLSASSNYQMTYQGANLVITQKKDYLGELYAKLNQAIALGGKQTVYWNQGTALPYNVMKMLEMHPDVTLVFSYGYEGREYSVTLSGVYVKADAGISWYGPLYLYEKYGQIKSDSFVNQEARVYVVVRGDTLSKLARRFHVTVNHLVAMNKIKNRNLIRVGQRLKY